MTTHELANILLQQEDVPVHFQYFDGGPEQYLNSEVISVHEHKGIVYLSEDRLLFPPGERYGEYEGEWIGEKEDGEDDEWPLYDPEPILHTEW